MSNHENWQTPFEDDGTTLGPEEALRREIEKSRALKVERLKMRDALEEMRAENKALREENLALKKKAEVLEKRLFEAVMGATAAPAPAKPGKPGLRLFLGALILAALVMGALLLFQSRS